MSEEKVVKIYTAGDRIETELILGALKDKNIPAYKKELGNSGLMNIYGNSSYEGVEIYVNANQAAAAKEVVDSVRYETRQEGTQTDQDQMQIDPKQTQVDQENARKAEANRTEASEAETINTDADEPDQDMERTTYERKLMMPKWISIVLVSVLILALIVILLMNLPIFS